MHRQRRLLCCRMTTGAGGYAAGARRKAVFRFLPCAGCPGFIAVRLLIVCAVFIAGTAFTGEAGYLQQARQCSSMRDRVQRLLCFDAVFRSTLEQIPVGDSPPAVERQAGPIRLMATVLEDQRAPGQVNWIMRVRPWHEIMLLTLDDYGRYAAGRYGGEGRAAPRSLNTEGVDIFMTMKQVSMLENRSANGEAILMLSCENDITTLGVLLPEPIRTLQANLSLSAGNGSLFRLNWRDVENGDVVIAGRGLESIDTIKTIANYERVQLQVTYPEGSRSFVFDMHDLKDRLKPLRSACHW